MNERSSLFGEGALAALNNPDDDSEEPKGAPENLHHQNLHERVRILGIRDRTSTSWNSHTNSELNWSYPQKRLEKPTEIPVQNRA